MARRDEPHQLGAMPTDRRMTTIDERIVRASPAIMFPLAAGVEAWPAHLTHYRDVHFIERTHDGGGLVRMSANRPFGPVSWPTWWTSLMSVQEPTADGRSSIRFRHVHGITTGMDVEWTLEPMLCGSAPATRVRIVHVWNGPKWPLIGVFAARRVIGPIFVHGIASRTLAGLAHVAERTGRTDERMNGRTDERMKG